MQPFYSKIFGAKKMTETVVFIGQCIMEIVLKLNNVANKNIHNKRSSVRVQSENIL